MGSKGDNVYFVHAYCAQTDDAFIVAKTFYEEINITAIVKNKNIYGCQFHPEKSGETGLKIIENFARI